MTNLPEPNDDHSGHFDLALLGTFRLTADGRVVVLHEREQRVVALLAVRDRTMGRSALAGILWPDASDANALSSLRSALTRLPAELRDQLTVTPRDLTLSREVSVDLRRARTLAQQLLAPASTLPSVQEGEPAGSCSRPTSCRTGTRSGSSRTAASGTRCGRAPWSPGPSGCSRWGGSARP
jgi:hypothetical protein